MSAPNNNKCVLSLAAVVLVVLAAAVCAVHGQDRVKMCGRDLIRLAVASCGSAILRRSVPDSQQQQQQQQQQRGGALAELDQNHQDHYQDQEGSMVPNWYPVSSRARRAAGMMSDVCCEKGCSMQELIQFC